MSKAFIIASLLFSWMALAEDPPREFLIHEGPVFTTPGLEPNEEIKFTKEFPVDATTLKNQPFVSLTDELPISAEKAIELAKASADAGDPPAVKNVIRLELLSFKIDYSRNALYYLVELNIRGNEVHRVVLMDGTVVKSRLRQLGGK